jgi:hypothetical protein
MAVCNDPLPERLVELRTASIITNAITSQPIGKGLVRVEVYADDVTLIYKKDAVRYRAGPGLKALMAALRRDQEPEEVRFDLVRKRSRSS